MLSPIDLLADHLMQPGALSLREVIRLLMLSGLFTVVCVLAFPKNAPTRRLLLIAVMTTLVVLPWLLASFDAVWLVAVNRLPPVTLNWSLPNVLLWIWMGVAVLLTLRHAMQIRVELKEIVRLPVLNDVRIEQPLARLAEALGGEMPEVRVGARACSTTLVGPTIVLPGTWTDWDPATLNGVLAHELVHVKRRDDRWLLLSRVVVLVYWWMPWLIWLYRLYVRAMEESCDDQASELVGHKLAYVDALVDAAFEGRRSRQTVATGMYQHNLVGRVGRFAELRVVEVDMRGLYWSLIAVLISVIFLTSVEPFEELKVVTLANKDGNRIVRAEESVAVPTPHVHDRLILPAGSGISMRNRVTNPVHKPYVIYPGEALNASVEGDVIVEFSVTLDGNVVGVNVISSTSDGLFDEAAVRAVRGTVYPPIYKTLRTALEAASVNQEDGRMRVRRYLQFRLNP